LGLNYAWNEAKEKMQGTRAKSFTVTTSNAYLKPEGHTIERYDQKNTLQPALFKLKLTDNMLACL